VEGGNGRKKLPLSSNSPVAGREIGCRGESANDEFPHLIPRLSLVFAFFLMAAVHGLNFILHKIVIKRDSQQCPDFFYRFTTRIYHPRNGSFARILSNITTPVGGFI